MKNTFGLIFKEETEPAEKIENTTEVSEETEPAEDSGKVKKKKGK